VHANLGRVHIVHSYSTRERGGRRCWHPRLHADVENPSPSFVNDSAWNGALRKICVYYYLLCRAFHRKKKRRPVCLQSRGSNLGIWARPPGNGLHPLDDLFTRSGSQECTYSTSILPHNLYLVVVCIDECQKRNIAWYMILAAKKTHLKSCTMDTERNIFLARNAEVSVSMGRSWLLSFREYRRYPLQRQRLIQEVTLKLYSPTSWQFQKKPIVTYSGCNTIWFDNFINTRLLMRLIAS
jgi:hypothetical protein